MNIKEGPVIIGDPDTHYSTTVESSCGVLHIDECGNVLYCRDEGALGDNPFRKFEPYLSLITKFDVNKFKEYWGRGPRKYEDILNFGYWNMKDGYEVYEEPAYDYWDSTEES